MLFPPHRLPMTSWSSVMWPRSWSLWFLWWSTPVKHFLLPLRKTSWSWSSNTEWRCAAIGAGLVWKYQHFSHRDDLTPLFSVSRWYSTVWAVLELLSTKWHTTINLSGPASTDSMVRFTASNLPQLLLGLTASYSIRFQHAPFKNQ